MTPEQNSHKCDSRWPRGDGVPPAACDRCKQRAWCVMVAGHYDLGFICEACAIGLGIALRYRAVTI